MTRLVVSWQLVKAIITVVAPRRGGELLRLRSQSVTLKRGTHLKYSPLAFAEHGAVMAANVLNSPRAVQMSIFVVRAFVRETSAEPHLVSTSDGAGPEKPGSA